MPVRLRLRVHGCLAAFLPAARRGAGFDIDCARAATLKNALEAAGVPHTEVGALRLDGVPATLDRIARDGGTLEVHPWDVQPLPGQPRFAADAHLGALARFLRMLGFDTVHANTVSDAELRRRSAGERRVVLTRDRELLKCRDLLWGAYVHALRPEAQLHEVAHRFDLRRRARPFSLCLMCNATLEPATPAQVAAYALPEVRARHRRFLRCPVCERVFWEGSHHARMRAALGLEAQSAVASGAAAA